MYLAQEFSLANYHVRGLDFRSKNIERKFKSKSILNGEKFTLNLNIDSEIDKRDDIIIIALKSYDINKVLISKLIDSKKEVLFLQNGLLVQSKFQSMDQPFGIGTISGIQSKLKGKNIDVKTNNASIFANLNNKTISLAELGVKQNLPHTKLNFSSGIQIDFYEKYIRWVVTCCLNLLNGKGIGDSLKLTPRVDVLRAINELVSFIDYEFHLKVHAENILNVLSDLPKNLKTSSYSDFKKGKPTEILNELNYVVSIIKTFDERNLILEKWKSDILNGS